MERIRWLIGAVLLIVSFAFTQGMKIGSGATLKLGSSALVVSGAWSNSGTLTAESGTIVFNGTSAQTIANASGETFYNLTVNKSSGDVQLTNSITINGTLTLTSGDLDLNGNSAVLGSNALLSETAGNTLKGNGTVAGTKTVSAPSALNVFGLGATVTSAANLGSTMVMRGHAVQSGNGQTSILRYFDIAPTTNTALDATLVFSYDESELNGKSESDLQLFRSTDGGVTWSGAGGTVNPSTNTIMLTGINAFSRWTLGAGSTPLPVQLVSFTARVMEISVELRWSTASEVNSYGFELERRSIERSESGAQWERIGFVSGAGTSVSPTEYDFVDQHPFQGRSAYRIKQIDNDGSFKYYGTLEVEIVAPTVFGLQQNYPNPFNPSTVIRYSLPSTSVVRLTIFNGIGQELLELVNSEQDAGYHEITWQPILSSGFYIYRIEAIAVDNSKNHFIETRKALFVK